MNEKILYAFWANCCGAWYKTPQKVVKKDDDGKYWHRDGNSDVEKEGLLEKDRYICFASKDKKKVQTFIDGFFVAQRLIRYFTRKSDKKKN